MHKGKLIVIEGVPGSGKTTLRAALVREFESRGVPFVETAEPTEEPTRLNYFGVAIRKLIERKSLTDEDIERVRASARALFAGDDEEESTARRKEFNRRFSVAITKIINRRELTELERQLFFIADRWFHLVETVRPALMAGTWVIMDRYERSTEAHYQTVADSDANFLERWQDPALGDLYVRPAWCFYLRVSPETAFARQRISGKMIDRYEENFAQVRTLVRRYHEVFLDFRRAPEGSPRRHYPFVSLDAERSADNVVAQALSSISFPLRRSEEPRFV